VALEIPVCSRCGHAVFPPRVACSRCGSTDWGASTVEGGRVDLATVVRRSPALAASGGEPIHLALVRTDLGPAVIARLRAPAEPGAAVTLSTQDGAVVAHPS
jgi:uncharacterized OB-fold protein